MYIVSPAGCLDSTSFEDVTELEDDAASSDRDVVVGKVVENTTESAVPVNHVELWVCGAAVHALGMLLFCDLSLLPFQ